MVPDGEIFNISFDLSSGSSELTVLVADASSAGTYQCHASDAGGKYITLSRKAIVEVILQGIGIQGNKWLVCIDWDIVSVFVCMCVCVCVFVC